MPNFIPMKRGLVSLVLVAQILLPTTVASAQTPGPPEPPSGNVFHGASPSFADDDAYMWGLDDPSLLPAVEGMHSGIPGTRPQSLENSTRTFLERQRIAGRIPHMSYSMSVGEGEPIDDVIATSQTYDHLIRAVGRAIRSRPPSSGAPIATGIGTQRPTTPPRSCTRCGRRRWSAPAG